MRSLEKGTFHTAVLKTWPLELRTKSPQVPVYTEDIVYFGSSESRFFLKIRKQYEAGIEICTGGKERAGKWEQLTEGKVFFFPRFYYTLDGN